jgi:hypothetical protein
MLKSAQSALRARPTGRVLLAARRGVATAARHPARVRGAAMAAAAVGAAAALYGTSSVSAVHADTPNFVGNIKDAVKSAEEAAQSVDTGTDWLSVSVDPANETLVSLVWGSNKYALSIFPPCSVSPCSHDLLLS